MSNNINNLNIYTFIREIYQSLKHLDTQLHDMNTQLNQKIEKIEQSQNILKGRFDAIEILLQKNLENSKTESSLNKNIESELLNKMSKLNNSIMLDTNKKINLNPEELTFANILENNYTFDDINQQLDSNQSSKLLTGYTPLTNIDIKEQKNNETIENLLF
jgi:hypothetical protein